MDTKQVIEELKRALPSATIALPGTTEYAAVRDQYQNAACGETTPACYVQPSSVEEVSIFVKTIKPFALNGSTPFAIVGLGQQPALLCSNIEAPGITLSLQHLKGVHVKDGEVEVAAGENWGSVYDALVERGLGFSGGRSYRSGIGGLALAGRSSFMPSQLGFIYLVAKLSHRWPVLRLIARRFHQRQREFFHMSCPRTMSRNVSRMFIFVMQRSSSFSRHPPRSSME